MDTQIFVQNVKKYCKMKGVDVTPACRECGIGHNFFQNVKKGKIPSVEKVQLLAAYLGVTTSDLLGEEIKLGEGDETEPAYRELRYIIDNASAGDRRRFLELIRMYKGFEDEAAERRKKRNSSAQSEAVEENQYPVFEACDAVEHGTYRCIGCGKDIIKIYDDGTKLRPCSVCGEIFWHKIK